jgi:hypothetical protein
LTAEAARPNRGADPAYLADMTKFLVWLILFFLCWPIALLALILFPIVWIILLPFRLLGIVVEGVFEFLRALVLLPSRALGK